MTTIGLIGIIAALVLFMVLVYKGYSNYYVAPVCVLIVAITNTLNPLTAFTGLYVNGIVEMIIALFSIIFLGAIFGKVFTDTGAASAIANILLQKYVLKKEGNSRIKRLIIAVIILGALCTLGGIDGYTQYFLFAPLCLAMLEQVNLPRRLLPGFLALNTPFIAFPGAPQIYNVLMVGAFAGLGIEVSSGAGLIAGLAGVIVILLGSYLVFAKIAIKAKDKGESFEWGPVEKTSINSQQLPPVALAVLPLIVTFVLYTILGLDVAISLTCGILCNLIFMGRYIEVSDGKTRWYTIKNVLNAGAGAFPGSIFSLCVPSGLAAVITSTAAFGKTVELFSGLNINLIILTVIATCVLVAITSSPPATLMIVIPLVVQVGGSTLSPALAPAIGRVAALAATTFETLPTNGAVLLGLSLAKTTHKQSYFPVFMETVICTLIGTLVCAAICLIFPTLP